MCIRDSVYIVKVSEDNKIGNNKPYKLFVEFLSVVIVPADMVQPSGSCISSFVKFYRCAQSYAYLALCGPTTVLNGCVYSILCILRVSTSKDHSIILTLDIYIVRE